MNGDGEISGKELKDAVAEMLHHEVATPIAQSFIEIENTEHHATLRYKFNVP